MVSLIKIMKNNTAYLFDELLVESELRKGELEKEIDELIKQGVISKVYLRDEAFYYKK